ncbi:hypothetical protein [Sphingopyxis sp. BSNA05]|uniref:hypothetical protein n=1 Tax=Sphingopyxis sp. BSNA05 TaxID=1236614 RepID=UPI001562F51F|nr:hypothetical protein [Sphingopyxis sp. BSNA05]
MNRTLLAASLLCLATIACSESTKVSDDLAESSSYIDNPTGRTERVETGPTAKPVRIGEGGPRFDACQSVGEVGRHVSGSLPVLSAPFDAAEKSTVSPPARSSISAPAASTSNGSALSMTSRPIRRTARRSIAACPLRCAPSAIMTARARAAGSRALMWCWWRGSFITRRR